MADRIDHVVINVEQQLDAARQRYQDLGFTLTPRGHHNRGTSNHLAIFAHDDYLELIGLEPANANKPGASWGHPPGLIGLALKTRDAQRDYAALKQKGLPLEGDGPADLSRPVEFDGKTLGVASFSTFRVAAERIPNGRVFYCQHHTPELVWRPEWLRHPNGALGVAEYVYVSRDPAASAKLFSDVYGAQRFVSHPHGVRWQLGAASVWWLTAAGIARLYGDSLAATLPHGQDRAVGLTIRVESLDATRKLLSKNGIDGAFAAHGRWVAPPKLAQDVALGFIEF